MHIISHHKKILYILIEYFYLFYSVLNANTGSFLAAFFDGIIPPINVKITLNIISTIAAGIGSTAVISGFPVTACITALIGIINNSETPIPIIPANNPTINVSALNIDEIFLFDAPIALKTPISFVLSNTDIYVIIPIIIEETINEMLTNAIKT